MPPLGCRVSDFGPLDVTEGLPPVEVMVSQQFLDGRLAVPGRRQKRMANYLHSKARIIQMAFQSIIIEGSLFIFCPFLAPIHGSPKLPPPGPLLQLFSRNRGIHHLMRLLHQLAV